MIAVFCPRSLNLFWVITIENDKSEHSKVHIQMCV